MAESINLSQQLINDVLAAIRTHEPEAGNDMMINIQYLVAVAGYLSAEYPGPAAERDELLEHLYAFMKHVCEDRVNSTQQTSQPAPAAAPAAVAGKSVPTDDPAVGIWKPE